MSNTSFLLDQNLWLPGDSPEAARAMYELQYSVLKPSKTNPSGIVKLYQEKGNYVLVPRHYLDLDKENCTYVGPDEFPLLTNKCFIEPWGANEEVRNIQRDAMAFLRRLGANPATSDAIVSLRCGVGKTCIGIRGAFDYGYHTLILAHTKEILLNWEEEILSKTDVKKVGKIISGEYDLQPVTIALIQSLIALPADKLKPLQKKFGCIIIDEMHHLSAEVFSQMGNAFPGRRIGLSATLAREDGMSYVYYMSLGRNLFYREVLRKKADVHFKRVNVDDVSFPVNYAKAVSTLASSKYYLNALEADIRTAYRGQHKQLVLSSRKDLIHALADRLSDLSVGVNVSEVPAEERHSNVRTKPITISVDSLGKEGLNEPSLTQIRVVTPIKDPNAIVQMVGRLEREADKIGMEAFFYAAQYGPFLRTLQKAKEGLVRHQYRVSEEI